MDLKKLLYAWLVACLLLTPALLAQEEGEAEPVGEIEDVVIVTASRTEQSAHEVPAAISVIGSAELQTMPVDDVGDALRNVPGLNVTQVSARDVQVSSRSSAGTLTTDTLVMMDNRTLYLDFFGFVMWDFLPADMEDIKQIEVVRGPSSAVWGANAMGGVVNVITKTPMEQAGQTRLTLGAGESGTAFGSLTHATGNADRGFKVSAGYYEQDAYDRPTGIVPGTDVTNPPGTPYPGFPNEGTTQPKVDLRYDVNTNEETSWSFAAGYAQTDGMMHTGIGPFDIDSGSNMNYFKAAWRKRAMSLEFFVNALDGEATNLLAFDQFGQLLVMGFDSKTYNLDFTNTEVVGESHILTYGLRARQNDFDLTLAPAGQDREEYGAFIQDEILIGDKMRWLIGARWDDLDPIGEVVSPRTSLMYSPSRDHTLRISYNEAYRAPSLIENHLDVVILNQVLVDPNLIFQGLVAGGIVPPGVPCQFVLTTCDPFGYIFPSLAAGNPQLQEEEMTAYEVGYVGTFGRTTVNLALYRNELKGDSDFYTAANYDTAPPPNWPVAIMTPVGNLPAWPPGVFPSLFSYRNVGEVIYEGLEFSVNSRPADNLSVFFNYTYQQDPEVTGIDPVEFGTPPNSRVNVGFNYDPGNWYLNGNVQYTEGAFWSDVLDSRFWGPTDDYTLVNLSVGFRFMDEKVTFGIMGTNITDDEIQTHVFGDIIPRKLVGELRFRF
jgi:outer membrane receptor protein involved in Fe transport